MNIIAAFVITFTALAGMASVAYLDLIIGLLVTVMLGVSFTSLQAYEYSHAAFGFKDGISP